MTEKPILFSGPMIQALLANRKTQTRRVVKPQPSSGVRYSPFVPSGIEDGHGREIRPKYFKGDRLWVRETWRPWSWREDNPIKIQYQADGAIGECDVDDDEWYGRIAEQATIECQKAGLPHDDEECYSWSAAGRECPLKWQPSIFLPRDGSRITLEVTDVRCQRVQNISEGDAKAEGAMFHDGHGVGHSGWRHDYHNVYATARDSFFDLWDSINGKKHPVSADPWVFAYTLRRLP